MAGTDKLVGNDVLLELFLPDQGTDGEYVLLEGQTEHSTESSNAEVDTSAKGDPVDVIVPGSESGSVSLTLNAVRPNATKPAQDALKSAKNTRTAVTMRETTSFPEANPDGTEDEIEEYDCYVMEFSKSSSRNEAVTFEVSLTRVSEIRIIDPVAA